jgi:hypothetical protein
LQSLKTTPKGRVRVQRRKNRGKGKENRGIGGAGGWGGKGLELKHFNRRREGGKEPFRVRREKSPKKDKKTCSPGGWLAKKKEKRLGNTCT